MRRADVIEVFGRPRKSVPVQIVGLIVRARAELLVITVTVVAMAWLYGHLDAVHASLVVAGVLAVIFGIPHSRRFVISRVWCVVDRHRLHTCLRQTKIRTMNMDGSLPFMLWARPTKTGERIWLWIRAGSSGGDIEDALEYIAPACYARDARVHRVRRLTTLVAIDIIRRDPLAKPSPIASPLARMTTGFTGTAAEGTEPIRPVQVTTITNAAPSARTTTSAAAASKTALIINGEDVSDYVD